MTILEYLALVGHVLAVVILVGSTVMMSLVILPAARRSRLSATAVRSIGQGFSLLTAVSGIALLVTGVYLTSVQYTFQTLLTTPSGWIALVSIGMWLVLAASLAVGTDRLAQSVAVGEVEAAAERSARWFSLALVVAVVTIVMSRVV